MYTSANAYYVDQSYIFEAGSVVLNQSNGNVMDANPLFTMNIDSDVNISFSIINISATGGKTSINSYGNVKIQTSYLTSSNRTINDIQNITILTDYPNSWKTYLNSTLNDSGLTYTDDYSIVDISNGIRIDFTSSYTENIIMQLFNIRAQIGHGWIK